MAPPGQHEADADLLRRVAAAETAAQEELLGLVVGRVRGICFNLLRQPADAEDAVQVALMEILRASGGYAGRGSVRSWVDRITARTAMRMARERGRRRNRLAGAVDPDQLPSADRCARAHEEMPRQMQAYLEHLSEPLRVVLLLRHAMEYSIDEIAEATGVSPNTVKDRLLRARRAMRKLIRRDQAIGVRGQGAAS